MKALFRSLFLKQLDELWLDDALVLPGKPKGNEAERQWNKLIRSLPKKWVVFIEPPFDSSNHLIHYLARYTHKAAISDQRILKANNSEVTFVVREGETQALTAYEFMHRFLLHALPWGFRKIRHYGLYAPANVNGRLEQARCLIGGEPVESPNEKPSIIVEDEDENDTPKWARLLQELTGKDPLRCPCCRNARLQLAAFILPRSPPRRSF